MTTAGADRRAKFDRSLRCLYFAGNALSAKVALEGVGEIKTVWRVTRIVPS